MTFGTDYAALYDALYESKDYAGEAQFTLDQLAHRIPRRGASLLDLGCGTGLHDIEFAKHGHSVTGVDLSPAMIAQAQRRAAMLPASLADRLAFKVGDLRLLNEGRQFDAVVSLFHVICYMADDQMLSDALSAARRHLGGGGAFLFDFWNRAAVVKDPPAPRTRQVEMAGRQITRTMTPRWEPDLSLVHITYELTEPDQARSASTETHSVRYFAPEELERHLKVAGFSGCAFGEWLTCNPPSQDTFGVYCVATVE